jgi:CRP-like cAMP-binding protein
MSNLSARAYLAHFPMFSVLNTLEMDRLVAATELVKTSRGGFIYLADEPCDFIALLVKGSVKISIFTDDGRELIKSIQHPQSIFGELGLAGEATRSDFASAMNQEAWYLKVPLEVFKSLMHHNSELTGAMIKHLGERLRRAERQCESLILKDVRTRIVEFLKENADSRGRQVGLEMMIKHGLTQQDIANLVGASRQTVAAILNELRKSNLIHFNRHTILIRDMEKLN